ncbi:MAG: SAM-dependent methyltransferase, partial [Armatimonadota bacterium]
MTDTAENAATAVAEASSFRDPSGFVFERETILYRQINPAGQDSYDRLMGSGLYEALAGKGLLIPHTEAPLSVAFSDEARAVLRPERIPFISYPYEWCFGQLRDAALTTLAIQREAMRFGMSLKDASAYNIQFRKGSKPVHIDTLSLEPYEPGKPWVAYRQFCQHFLAPLALMSHADVRLGQLQRVFLDGLPLDVTARLLPLRDRLDPSLLPHIFLHSSAQQRHGNDGAARTGAATTPSPEGTVSQNALLGLLDNLEAGVRRLS